MSKKKLKDGKDKYIKDSFGRYRYEVRFRLSGRDSTNIRNRIWARNDTEADEYIAKVKGDSFATVDLTWREGLKEYFKEKDFDPKDEIPIQHAVEWIADNTHQVISKVSLASFSNAIQKKQGGDPTKGRTANKYRAYALAVARWLRKNGKIASIPFEHAPMVKQKQNQREPFTLAEIPMYFNALSDFARPLAEMLLLTSERVTAITGILLSDIERHGVLRVKQKGGSIRDIPITPEIKKVIDKALNLKPKNEISKNRKYLFITETGKKSGQIADLVTTVQTDGKKLDYPIRCHMR
jgi:integrase